MTATFTEDGGLNNPPQANPDAYSMTQNGVLSVTAPGVLENDTDVEGQTLSAILDSAPLTGTLLLNSNGSFTYTPTAGFVGADSFTYHAHDGGLDSNVVTVTIMVNEEDEPPAATDDFMRLQFLNGRNNKFVAYGDQLALVTRSNPFTLSDAQRHRRSQRQCATAQWRSPAAGRLLAGRKWRRPRHHHGG